MDAGIRSLVLGMAVFFLIIFGGMTLVALSTAELNFATLFAGGASIFICLVVVIGLVGAIRNPPDED